jgi:hypothetical protein
MSKRRKSDKVQQLGNILAAVKIRDITETSKRKKV